MARFRSPGKGKSSFHGARPVIWKRRIKLSWREAGPVIQWIRTSGLSITNSLSLESNTSTGPNGSPPPIRPIWLLVVSGFGFRGSDFGFQVSGFGFQVSGFGIGVSCFRFRVLGFGHLLGVLERRDCYQLPRPVDFPDLSVPWEGGQNRGEFFEPPPAVREVRGSAGGGPKTEGAQGSKIGTSCTSTHLRKFGWRR